MALPWDQFPTFRGVVPLGRTVISYVINGHSEIMVYATHIGREADNIRYWSSLSRLRREH